MWTTTPLVLTATLRGDQEPSANQIRSRRTLSTLPYQIDRPPGSTSRPPSSTVRTLDTLSKRIPNEKLEKPQDPGLPSGLEASRAPWCAL